MKMSKSTGFFIFLVVCIALSLMIRKYEYNLSKQTVYGDAVEQTVSHLRVERQKLETEQKAIIKEQTQEKLGKGVATFVFTELSPQIYEDAYLEMQKHGYTGVLALSDTQFPGKENCLSLEQFHELIDAGWSVCIQWDAFGELDEYLSLMRQEFTSMGEELPDIIYFTPDRYQDKYDEALKQAGFTIVVHHGEGHYSLITRSDETSLWHVAAVSWNRSGIKGFLDKVARYGGAMSMNVDFGDRRSGYKKDIFKNMCDYMATLDQRLLVKDYHGSREYRQFIGVDMALQSEIDWYQNEIDEINKEIESIYKNN